MRTASIAASVTARSRRVGNGVIVRQVDHTHIRDLLGTIVVGLILLLSILFYVWQRNEMIRYGYEAKQLRKEHEEQLEERRRLLLQRASLESLDRIDSIARSKLGFSSPPEDRVFLLEISADGRAVMSKADRAPESLVEVTP